MKILKKKLSHFCCFALCDWLVNSSKAKSCYQFYGPRSIKYTWQATWHFNTHAVFHVSPGSQIIRLSLTTSLFEYAINSLSRDKYSFIYKSHIIYKLQLSTHYYLQASNYLQGLLRHRKSPYKWGHVGPTLLYKYLVLFHPFNHLFSPNS